MTGAMPSPHILELSPQGEVTNDWDVVAINALEQSSGGVNELSMNGRKVR